MRNDDRATGGELDLALYTALDAIATHADQLVHEVESRSAARERAETIRLIARYAVELAAQARSASAEHAGEPVSSDPREETILLVEDMAVVRQLVARMLRAAGYDVIEAENGEDALDRAAARAAPIDLVLSDVNMPRMSGAELFDALRRWYPAIRVLLMSGYDADVVAERVAASPRTAFIAKPFIREDLLEAVRELLDG
jgi:two-component system cell cycle sensor histidine kinase/response regulator CckA